MADNTTVVLRVQLDEGKTEEQLKQLVLDIEKTRASQLALNASRKAGQVTDEQYAQQVVQLRQQLKAQQTEQTALTKNLDLYRTATGELANSYAGQQAQLSLAQRQYQQLEGSQSNSTESTKALATTIAELRGELKTTDEVQGLFVRNIGNYPKGENLESLVRQLVKLQEETKGLTAGTEEASRAQMRIVGFQTQAAQAGAKEGKTFQETTDFIREYAESIRPATADLVKLSKQQEEVAQSGEDVGEALQQIGFKIGAAKKNIEDVTKALGEVPEVAAEGASETKGLGSSLLEAAKSSDVLGGAVEVLSSAKEKYTTAVELAKVATMGEAGALGVLKLALIATGLGIFVVVLGSVVSFLTKSQTGVDFLNRKLAALGAVVRIASNLFTDLGGKIVAAAENPKKAFTDLVEFLEQNVLNRIKSIGVLIDGIKTGNIEKIGDSFIQATTGITDGTAKLRAFGEQVSAAADSAERLAQMQRELERAEDDNIATNKTLLNQVERLKNVRDNEFNTIQKRKAANEEAYRIEKQREATLTDLASKRVALLNAQIAQEGGRDRVSRERFQELQEAENNLQDIREDAAGKQNELITNRYQLEQERLDKLVESRGQALATEAKQLTQQLAIVQLNSDEELAIRQRQLRNEQQTALNVKKLTIAQLRAIDVDYETKSLALTQEFNKQRALAAYDAEVATVNAELALVQQGTQQETELRRNAIDAQLQKELAALDKRKDNAAQEALLRANAAKAINDVNYAAASAATDKYLQDERNALDEQYARGLVKEKDYNSAVLASDTQAAAMRLQLAKTYGQQTGDLQQQLTRAQIAQIQAVTEAERIEQGKRVALAQQLGEGLASLLAETVATTGATLEDFARKSLILVIDSVERTLVAAQIKIIAESFASADSIATFGAAGLAKSVLIIAAVTGASEILKSQLQAPTPQQFAQGTVLGGASHANGGTQLYGRNGHWYGEAEEGEAVINKRSTALFLPLLSTINQLGGGRALGLGMPNYARMALGSITTPVAREQLRGTAGQYIDYERLAQATAKALRQSPPVTRISDVQAGLNRASETDRLANA